MAGGAPRVIRSCGDGDFPRPVAGDRYRLDTLIAWEDRQVQEQQRLAEHTSTPFPMRKRHRGGAAPT